MTTGIRPDAPYIVCGTGGCKGWTPTKDRPKTKFENALKRLTPTNHESDTKHRGGQY